MGRYSDRSPRICIGILSFLFWVASAILLYAVYYLVLLYKSYRPFFHDFYILLPCGAAVIGVFFLLVNGLFGCIVSRRGNRCCQGTFMYLIVVLVCLEASGAVLAFVYKNRMDYELKPMLNAFEQYNDSKSETAVNKIQQQLQCCGLQNYSDWTNTSWYNKSGHFVPKTCCNVVFSSCSGNITESSEFYHEGCFVKLHQKLSYFMTWLFWAFIAVICVEVLAAAGDGVLMTRNPFQDFRILDSATFT
ncbi:tetraspanin-3-like isoform 1-T1 [Rhinophrynus dorsalis]